MVKSYIINLLFSFNLLFSIIFIIIFTIIHIFAAKSGTHWVVTLLWAVKCVIIHFYSSYDISCCVVPFLWGPQAIWFVIPSWTMLPDMTHINWNNTLRFTGIPGIPGMQHTKFFGGGGVCVTQQYLGDVWVIFRSPRVTYYTSYTFGFNMNT